MRRSHRPRGVGLTRLLNSKRTNASRGNAREPVGSVEPVGRGTADVSDLRRSIQAHSPGAVSQFSRGDVRLPTTPTTCDGCSACCHVVGHPPFLLELDNGIPRPIEGADSQVDYQRLRAAPPEAQFAYLTNHGAINCPCTWLDEGFSRCRYYEFRPDVCRTFEVGGNWCSKFRVLHEIG